MVKALIRRLTAPRPGLPSWQSLSLPAPLFLACLTTLIVACSDRTVKPKHPNPPRALNASPASGEPVWSPDGAFLYFNHRPLVRIYESPPGSGLYLYEFADSLAGFYRVDLSGQNLRQVHTDGLSGPSMSRDGFWIYYVKGGQIWRVAREADTLSAGSAIQVTNSPDGAFSPSVSPGGTRLLYDVSSGSNPGIFITGVEGGTARHVGGTAWVFPDWGPNDSAFAFVGQGNIVSGIAIVDTFGVGALPLMSDGSYPKWSPDGQSIAFLKRVSANGAQADQLWVMNRDGTGARQLTTEGIIPGFSWRPTSSEIAYTRFSYTDTSYINGTIWVINPLTLQRRQVTFNPDP